MPDRELLELELVFQLSTLLMFLAVSVDIAEIYRTRETCKFPSPPPMGGEGGKNYQHSQQQEKSYFHKIIVLMPQM